MPPEIAERVVAWFRRHRRDLPWRRTRDPYAIWVSEVMLQQTRIAAVLPYYERWMDRFPSAERLAAAPLDDVLAAWSGLGYYGRARNLHRGAREVVERHGGRVPDTAAELRSLPGVGRYTAGAIASIGFGRREPLVDGNVARVLARLFAIEEDVKSASTARRLWQIAGELVPAGAPGDFNQGLMELGQEVCTPAAPRCEACPLAGSCAARATGRTAELPLVGKRQADADKPLLRARAAWIERGGRVLLARRRPEGLFGGLWELPQAPDRERLHALFSALGAQLELGAPRPVFRHRQVLSHRRLELDVYVARLAGRPGRGALAAGSGPYERLAWHSLATLGSLGVAASSHAILQKRHRETHGWTSGPAPSRSSKRASRRSSTA
ncbi:MAG TPA: A/G-specific adenine glycosylase [Kofleriaceae bacterium]|nr:A/G-specific adenine glycosylase [Kofleriaceae bacterium]